MPINLKIIAYADSTAVKLEKLNYNFDQLRKNGGGPQGATGIDGNPGIQGAQGATGAQGPIGATGGTGVIGDESLSYWVADDNGGQPEKKIWVDISDAAQLPSISSDFTPSVLMGITQNHANYTSPNTDTVVLIHKLPYAYDSNIILTNDASTSPANVEYAKINLEDNVLSMSFKEEDLISGGVNGVLRLDTNQIQFKSSSPLIAGADIFTLDYLQTTIYKDIYFNKQPGVTSPNAEVKASASRIVGNPLASIDIHLDIANNTTVNMVAMSDDIYGEIKWKIAEDAGASPPIGSVVDIDDGIFNDTYSVWTANTTYMAKSYVVNGDNTYYTATGGLQSAASGGPTGTGGAIVDLNVTWAWQGLQQGNNPGKNFILKQNNQAHGGAWPNFFLGAGVIGTKYQGWYLCNGQKWTDGGTYNFNTQDLNSFKWHVNSAQASQSVTRNFIGNDMYRTASSAVHYITTSGNVYNISTTVTDKSLGNSDGIILHGDSGYFAKSPGPQLQHIGYATKRMPRIVYLGKTNLYYNIKESTDTVTPIPVNFKQGAAGISLIVTSQSICSTESDTLYNFPAFAFPTVSTSNNAWIQNTPQLVPIAQANVYLNSLITSNGGLYKIISFTFPGGVAPGHTIINNPPVGTTIGAQETKAETASGGFSITYEHLGPSEVYQFPTNVTGRLNFQDKIYKDADLSALAPIGYYAALTHSQGHDGLYERCFWDGTQWDITRQENCITGCSVPFSPDIICTPGVGASGATYLSGEGYMTSPYRSKYVYQDSRYRSTYNSNSVHNRIDEGYLNLYDDLWLTPCKDCNSNTPQSAPEGRYKDNIGNVRTWFNPIPPGWSSGWGSIDINAFDYNPIHLGTDIAGCEIISHDVYFSTNSAADAYNNALSLNISTQMRVRQFSDAFNLHDVVYKKIPAGTQSFGAVRRTGAYVQPGTCQNGLSSNVYLDIWFVAQHKLSVTGSEKWHIRKWNGCCWEGSVICGENGGGFMGSCDDELFTNNIPGQMGGYQPY